MYTERTAYRAPPATSVVGGAPAIFCVPGHFQGYNGPMLIIGLVLLVLGIVVHIPLLLWLGVLLLIIGAVFELLGASGRAVGGRRHYW